MFNRSSGFYLFVFVFLMAVLFLLVGLLLPSEQIVYEFNRVEWIKSDGDLDRAREKMIGDLMENHLKIGIPYDSIIAMLGKKISSR